MAVPDFSKIWASQSPLTPYKFSDEDYIDGWEFIGEIPPDRRMLDTWQRQADTKMQWLKNNMLGYLLRQNSTQYEVGDIAFSASLPSSLVLECTTAGITAATEPDFSGASAGGTVQDGEVVWTYQKLLNLDDGIPVGVIFPYGGNGTLPDKYLLCDSSAVSRTLYPELFAVLGTTWGAGDGSTTFNLPNAADLVMQGASTTNPVGTYKAAGLPDITGYVQYKKDILTGAIGGAFTSLTNAGSSQQVQILSSSTANQNLNFKASNSNSIYGNSVTVQPPAACVRFMIKYE